VEVARRRAARPRAALAGEPDARAVIDTGRNLDVQLLELLGDPAALASGTRLRRNPSRAVAALAATTERHRPATHLDLAAAAALGTRRARALATGPMTDRTLARLGELDGGGRPADGVEEVDLERR